MGKAGNIIANCVLGLVLLVLIGVMVAPSLIGFQLEPVLSGSMEPTVHTGALIAIVKTDPTQIKVGDVIGFHATGIDTPVCHRVIEITQTDSGYGFITKGDANNDADPWVIAPKDLIGKVPFNIAWFGFAAKFIKTPAGFIVLMGIPALAIIILEMKNLLSSTHTKRRRPRLMTHPTRWPQYLPFLGGLILLVTCWGMMIGNHSEKTLGSMTAPTINNDNTQYTAKRTMQNKGKLPLVICLKSADQQIMFSENYFQLAPGEQKEIEITGDNQDAVILTSGFFPLLPKQTLYSLFKWNSLLAPGISLSIWIIPLVISIFVILKITLFKPQLNRRVKLFRGVLANE
jgi:signal peptidase I